MQLESSVNITETLIQEFIGIITDIHQFTKNWSLGKHTHFVVLDQPGWKDSGYNVTACPVEISNKIIRAKRILLSVYTRRGFKDMERIYKPIIQSGINFQIFNEGKPLPDGTWHRPAFRVGWLTFRMYGIELPHSELLNIEFSKGAGELCFTDFILKPDSIKNKVA
jgi:hypothetical protein